jgi:PhoPQ-activated pathogenicity-related protein
MVLPLLALLAAPQGPPTAFYDYLKKADSSYSAKTSFKAGDTVIDLTSQTWQGIPWKHTVYLKSPKDLASKGVAILYITGDGPKPADYLDIGLIAAGTRLPVATLFNVPNQPIWEKKEDDLIAYTFMKYLETGDTTWPLLFPMAKSAIRAMDAVESATKGTSNPITKFVVGGASKRGWTTWFVGAAKDPRVIGIAPMVIDNLNVERQMPHQIDQWGEYSEQIVEYTKLGLQEKLATPEGKRLARMIDPFYYLTEIKVPTLIVTGANDQYWTVDAMSQYWSDLKMPHWASIVPNAGHELGDKKQAISAVGAFANALVGKHPMPRLDFGISKMPGKDGVQVTIQADSRNQPMTRLTVLAARSTTTDFRLSKWEEVAVDEHPALGTYGPDSRKATASFAVPGSVNMAVLAQAQFGSGSTAYTLSRPVTVFKKLY